MSDVRFLDALAVAYSEIPNVEAVTLGGSRAGDEFDSRSDFDLYVYAGGPVDLAAREQIARTRSPLAEVGNAFWEPGDAWREGERRVAVDVTFRECEEIEAHLARVIDHCEASVGYTTCRWHSVRTAQVLYDREGWMTSLKARASVPFPEALIEAVVRKNLPILEANQSSYTDQIRSAVERGDWVGVNHRVAALLASVYDIVFSVNRQTHPGNKRLVKQAQRLCPRRPTYLDRFVNTLLRSAHQPSAVRAAQAVASEVAHWVAVEFPQGRLSLRSDSVT